MPGPTSTPAAPTGAPARPAAASAPAGAPCELRHLRASAARAAARDGVAALLALVPAPGAPPLPAAPPAVVADGEQLAALLGASWRALAGDQRGDDLAVLAVVLAAVGETAVLGPLDAGCAAGGLDPAGVHIPAPRHR